MEGHVRAPPTQTGSKCTRSGSTWRRSYGIVIEPAVKLARIWAVFLRFQDFNTAESDVKLKKTMKALHELIDCAPCHCRILCASRHVTISSNLKALDPSPLPTCFLNPTHNNVLPPIHRVRSNCRVTFTPSRGISSSNSRKLAPPHSTVPLRMAKRIRSHPAQASPHAPIAATADRPLAAATTASSSQAHRSRGDTAADRSALAESSAAHPAMQPGSRRFSIAPWTTCSTAHAMFAISSRMNNTSSSGRLSIVFSRLGARKNRFERGRSVWRVRLRAECRSARTSTNRSRALQDRSPARSASAHRSCR